IPKRSTCARFSACSYVVIQTPSLAAKYLISGGRTWVTKIETLALTFLVSSRSLGSQEGLQFFVRFVSHKIEPAVCPCLLLTFCHISPPSTPLGTGRNSS